MLVVHDDVLQVFGDEDSAFAGPVRPQATTATVHWTLIKSVSNQTELLNILAYCAEMDGTANLIVLNMTMMKQPKNKAKTIRMTLGFLILSLWKGARSRTDSCHGSCEEEAWRLGVLVVVVVVMVEAKDGARGAGLQARLPRYRAAVVGWWRGSGSGIVDQIPGRSQDGLGATRLIKPQPDGKANNFNLNKNMVILDTSRVDADGAVQLLLGDSTFHGCTEALRHLSRIWAQASCQQLASLDGDSKMNTHLHWNIFAEELNTMLLHVLPGTIGHVLVKTPQQNGPDHDGDIETQASQEATALQGHIRRPDHQGLSRA
ncbi:hypothetical protein INR49_016787, partial [Caranx melampygus]